jgi:ribosomal protein S18 acetylase RimI-like enzyme
VIRRLAPGDEDVLRAIAGRYKEAAPSAEQARAFLAEPAHYLLAALDGAEPVGFALGYLMERIDGRRMMFFYELEVGETHRRRGLGRALSEALARHARDEGAYKMWVQTDGENEPATRTYAAAGGQRLEPVDVLFAWAFG